MNPSGLSGSSGLFESLTKSRIEDLVIQFNAYLKKCGQTEHVKVSEFSHKEFSLIVESTDGRVLSTVECNCKFVPGVGNVGWLDSNLYAALWGTEIVEKRGYNKFLRTIAYAIMVNLCKAQYIVTQATSPATVHILSKYFGFYGLSPLIPHNARAFLVREVPESLNAVLKQISRDLKNFSLNMIADMTDMTYLNNMIDSIKKCAIPSS